MRMCSHEYYTLSGEVANKYLGNLKNYAARISGYVATCETKGTKSGPSSWQGVCL